MNHDTYLRIALLMRYVLAGAGLFTALWALHAALRDQANARQIRRTEAEFGAVAVLFVSPTEKKGAFAKLRGKSEEKPPRLGRSGSVGSGRAADVRIKGIGLDRRHFDYEIDKKTMRVFPVQDRHRPDLVLLHAGLPRAHFLRLPFTLQDFPARVRQFFRKAASVPHELPINVFRSVHPVQQRNEQVIRQFARGKPRVICLPAETHPLSSPVFLVQFPVLYGFGHMGR